MQMGWHEPIMDKLEAKLEEIIAIFQFHTWRGYPEGMNLTLPGLEDYKHMGCLGAYSLSSKTRILAGKIGGKINGPINIRKIPREILVSNGQKVGRRNSEIPGYFSNLGRIGNCEGKSRGGHIAVESGQLARIASLGAKALPQEVLVRGGKTSGSKNASKPGYLISLNCLRWNINRGKPCTCGKHMGS